MLTEHLVPAIDFCTSHQIDFSFIQSLQEHGMIEIVTIQEAHFIHSDNLFRLEQFMRLYFELDINLAGIDAITHLLQRIEDMQEEIRQLKNKLHLYEVTA